MMMPQLLESTLTPDDSAAAGGGGGGDTAASDGDADAAAQLVAAWVDRVALAAAGLYLGQLAQVRGLSAQGAVQLVADIEYFCNVLNTLGLGVPPALAAWQAALMAADADALRAVAELAGEEGGSVEARAAVETVGRLRRLS